ncbi:MAG: N-acetylneuraminate synthase family protein [Planctomycetota bacterium]|jgi:N-acetylneuraminate synthase/N,N'-diacetyllegionaminate synthase|nr:N-acetylneuraminate synthase family protein [Planctomycetota bacterium]
MTLSSNFKIGPARIGPQESVYVIAEVGVNHDGSLSRAIELVEAAADTGVQAVKFQVFRADLLVSPDTPQADYQACHAPARSQHEMLSRLEMEDESFVQIARRCRELGVEFLASPFDERSLEFLLDLDVSAIKLGSGELTNHPLIEKVGSSGKPLLLSTGMSRLEEIQRAVRAFEVAGGRDLLVFHCTSSYPAPIDSANLRAIETLIQTLKVPVGYSDHTVDFLCPLAAVALGACCLERHLTLDRGAPGPDHAASTEPEEMRRLVGEIRRLEAALGDGNKEPAECEEDVRGLVRKSIVAARDLSVGEHLQLEGLTTRRPGTGISPERMGELLGRSLKREVASGAQISMEDLA